MAKEQGWSLGLDVSASRRSRDLILIVSVLGESGKVSSRSRLKQNFKRLSLILVSSSKVSFTS